MWMTVLIVAIIIISLLMESDSGKIILFMGVCGIGLLALSLLFDTSFFIFLAKACAAIIILIIVFILASSIFGG